MSTVRGLARLGRDALLGEPFLARRAQSGNDPVDIQRCQAGERQQPCGGEIGAQIRKQQPHRAKNAGIARHEDALDLELAASRAACSGPAPPNATSV